MERGKKVKTKDPHAVAEALARVGSTVLFANPNLGCALAFTNTGNGVERKTHRFSTSHPITAKGALSRAGRNELVAAGILTSKGQDSSSKRLIARGAVAAAFAGALLMSGGANNAMAQDLGLNYFGGTNPLAEVQIWDAKPAFVDIDKDGDLDCFIGDGDGYIEYWKNTGTANSPNFVQITGDGNPLTSTVVDHLAAPTFVDIDDDGDMDAFIGHRDPMYQTWSGKTGELSVVSFFENTGTPQVPVFTNNAVITNTHKAINYNPLIVQGFDEAVPTFADIDGDGDMDAFVGSEYGHIYGYENMTINDENRKVFTNTIGFMSHGPMYADYGDGDDYIWAYGGAAAPAFVDADGDGDLDLFVGNKYGAVQYFRNDGDKFNFDLVAVDMEDNPATFNPGMYSSPAVADINGDGLDDLFFGASPFDWFDKKADRPAFFDTLYSNLFVRYYQNVGTTDEADFRSRGDNPFNLGPLSLMPTTAFGDVDGDGDLDAMVGGFTYSYLSNGGAKTDSKIYLGYFPRDLRYYENKGSQENPLFSLHSMEDNPWGGRQDWYLPTPAIADLNGDGVNETYVGYTYDYSDTLYKIDAKDPISAAGRIEAFQYVTATGTFEEAEMNPLGKLDVPIYPQPFFVDIDGDGDLDVFITGWDEYQPSLDTSRIAFYRNNGTSITPTFSVVTDTNPLTGVVGTFLPTLSFADVDGDGDKDAVLGERYPMYSRSKKEEENDWDTRYFKNIGSATEPVFEEQTGENNPFTVFSNKIMPGAVTLADLDNDQDIDAVVGDYFGKLYYYRNIGDADEAFAVLKDDDDLCFIESAKSDSSLWDKIADSCKQGAQKIRNFFSPS